VKPDPALMMMGVIGMGLLIVAAMIAAPWFIKFATWDSEPEVIAPPPSCSIFCQQGGTDG